MAADTEKEKTLEKQEKEVARKKPIPQFKIDTVKNLAELIKNRKTVMIVSIRNLPARKLQKISKEIRGQAEIKVPKKTLFSMAIDKSKVEIAKELKGKIDVGLAVLFSDQDAFETASELQKHMSPAEAKPGQIAPEDVVIKKGPTDLPPGPAITELNSAGLEVQIEKGKVAVKEDTPLVKKGEEIPENAATVMSKLGIKPFSIGIIPQCAVDTKENKYYSEIKIDPDEAKEELLNAYERALPFAVEIEHFCEETIGYILAKAEVKAKAMESFTSKEESSEEKKEESEGKEEGGKEEGGKESKEEGNEEEKEAADGKEDGKESKEEGSEENTQQENKSQDGGK